MPICVYFKDKRKQISWSALKKSQEGSESSGISKLPNSYWQHSYGCFCRSSWKLRVFLPLWSLVPTKAKTGRKLWQLQLELIQSFSETAPSSCESTHGHHRKRRGRKEVETKLTNERVLTLQWTEATISKALLMKGRIQGYEVLICSEGN